jgi:TatD DNase family protein
VVTPPVPPAPLPRPALDSHTHLDMVQSPVADVVAAARAAGIARVVTVGTDLASSRWSVRCAEEHDGVWAAVAIHPNEVAEVPAGALAEIEALAGHPRVVAVGETGLDYYRDRAAPDVQRRWFREHIAIAKRAGKALMIHDRDAHADVLRILEQESPPGRVVFHCFSGDVAMVKQCAEAGYVMSFAGNVTFANAQPLRDAAAAAPAELLLAETDAPFLTPVPNRGRPNSPAMAAYTVRCLAEVKGMELAELCDALTATADRTFGPW